MKEAAKIRQKRHIVSSYILLPYVNAGGCSKNRFLFFFFFFFFFLLQKVYSKFA